MTLTPEELAAKERAAARAERAARVGERSALFVWYVVGLAFLVWFWAGVVLLARRVLW